MNALEELECKALGTSRWFSSAGGDTTIMHTEEHGTEPEPCFCTTEETTTGILNVNTGLTMAGTMAGESSYGMKSSDWIEYYHDIYVHQSFVCLKSVKGDTDALFYLTPIETAGCGHPSTEGEEVLIMATSFPYGIYLDGKLRDFCSEHNLFDALRISIELVRKCFPSVDLAYVRHEYDPETEEEWLAVDISVESEIEDVLDRYDIYTRLWISLVPWASREKIRLSYDIL